MGKWQKFHTRHSPVKKFNPNTGDSAFADDWLRSSTDIPRFEINGIKFEDYKERYPFYQNNAEDTKKSVNKLISEVVLKNLSPNLDKEAILEYLNKTFHQGGYLYPVSTPLSHALNDEAGIQAPGSYIERQISILSTEKGFKIQEIIKSSCIMVTDDRKAPAKLQASSVNNLIMADEGKYLLKAEATLDLDFSQSTDNPILTVESNAISYGKGVIREALDTRSLGERITDFFRSIFGLNKVKELSVDPVKESVKADAPEVDSPEDETTLSMRP
ncbi:MAG: hypothetical protein BGO90_13040 [Legionella sp. 40-6]|nr:hypothetical protein [Legionella sp.]OJY40363.1 MAG: hypothetical protein BGO90_13040 [Legionella sp. 40-6]